MAIVSPSGGEGPVAEHLVDVMRSSCRHAYVDVAGNAIGHWGTGALHVWLLGHIDTVPGPIEVRLVDGVLHGRGAVDAKGSFCAFVAAVARLPGAVARRLSVTLVGAVGEEAPGSIGARHAVATLPRPDLVVIGEPSGWDAITLGYKGTMQVDLRAEEPSRHSSVDVPTAAERVVEAYNAARGLVDGLNDAHRSTAPTGAVTGASDTLSLFERLQLRLLELSATDDGLAQRAHARLGFRLPPAIDHSGLADRLAVLTDAVGVRSTPVPGAVAAYRTVKTGDLPAAFRSAIRRAGGTPRHKLKTGTSDMNVVASAWSSLGLEVPPMVAYGPGDSDLDHTPDERLAVSEYLQAITVLEHALTALVEADGRPPGAAAAGAAS